MISWIRYFFEILSIFSDKLFTFDWISFRELTVLFEFLTNFTIAYITPIKIAKFSICPSANPIDIAGSIVIWLAYISLQYAIDSFLFQEKLGCV